MKRIIVLALACVAATFPLSAQDPTDANGWEQLGSSQHAKGQYREAAASFQKAVDMGFPPVAKYNLACALARLGEKDKAIILLGEVLATPAGPFPLATDPDFESLRTEPKFQALVARAKEATEPCMHPEKHPEYRQLDFWVGNWDVVDQGGHKVGDSHVDLILKNCVLMENWTDSQGNGGKSINKYDSVSGKWEQFWVADNGITTHFTGTAGEGEMRYVYERKLPNGSMLTRHLTFTRLPEGKVRQLSQRTIDAGKTWVTEYDFVYVPRKN
jgi:hypothetical protein